MKKIVIAIAAAFLMSAGAMAQEENKGERKQPTKEQMAQHRTDGMVKQYGLNEEQAAKLLELNLKYSDQMGPRRGGPRHPGMRHQGEGSRKQMPDSVRKQGPREFKGERGNFQEMRKKMEEYDAQLQTILTKEQYDAYKADREKMRQQGPRGERPHKNN